MLQDMTTALDLITTPQELLTDLYIPTKNCSATDYKWLITINDYHVLIVGHIVMPSTVPNHFSVGLHLKTAFSFYFILCETCESIISFGLSATTSM